MTDRRFSEEEVAAIFKQATEAKQTLQRELPSGEGLTLAEIQEIGRQVGIAPELVSQAAASLVQVGTPTSRKMFGLPIGVGRTVDLDRKLSDAEWERLVVDLRETFRARGRVTQEGTFRQWTNGNLQVLLEPTESGSRIRLSTIKSNSIRLMNSGQVLLGIAAVTSIAALIGGSSVAHLSWAAEIVFLGGTLFTVGAIRVSGWAALRRKQMEEIAARLALGATSLPPQE